ncbi:MAG: lamin tail domain-containing protein, partial [Bacteroidota bacterium]
IDTDFSTAISISSNGTMTGDPVSGSWSGGVATFASLVHTVAETGRTITASSGVLTDAISDPFIIIDLPTAWINEIHYDNDGTDSDEKVEIVIDDPGSYTLGDFQVTLYNETGGVSYDSETLDNFVVGITSGTATIYTWAPTSIQNGPNDGIALSYSGSLIQFLSYEGSLLATNGPASGVTSTDIGVSEASTSTVGYSLQLSGTGCQYSDFTWQGSAANTMGAVNNSQTLCASSCTAPTSQPTGISFSPVSSTSVTVEWSGNGDGDGRIVVARASSAVTATPTNGTAHSADPVFGDGADLGSSQYVVYRSTGSSVTVTNLTAGATYYFAIFEYNNTDDCYLLTSPLTGTFFPCPKDLFISEYHEPDGGLNKGIEVYNGTGVSVDLSIYYIGYIVNDGTDIEQSIQLSGTLQNNEVVCIYNNDDADPTFEYQGNINIEWTSADWNGDDAVYLLKNGNTKDYIIDAIGDYPPVADPGTEYVNNGVSTLNVTLVRNSNITSPTITWLGTEWDEQAAGTYTDWGSHTMTSCENTVVATKLLFVQQPGDVGVNMNISPSVTVEAVDANGNRDPDYDSETITMAYDGCGTLSNTTAIATDGLATFSSLLINRQEPNVSLTASCDGDPALTDATSNTFNVTAPSGGTIRDEDFEGTPTWNYSSFSVDGGAGGANGKSVISTSNTKGVSSSNAMTISYTKNNAAADQYDVTTIDFNSVTIPANYTNIKLLFSLISYSDATLGNGVDNADYAKLEIKLDGAGGYSTAFTQDGNNDLTWTYGEFSVTLNFDDNASYSGGTYKSEYTITIPDNTTQVDVRFTFVDNRINEWWCLDDLDLQGDAPGLSVKHYRSTGDTETNSACSWETADDEAFTINVADASVAPDYISYTIKIRNGHTWTLNEVVTLDEVTVESSGTLTVNDYDVTINNGTGVDLIVNGTLTDNAASGNGLSFNADAKWQLGANGTIIKTNSSGTATYRDNYESGMSNIPSTANWIVRKTGAGNPTLTAIDGSYYPNLTIENNSGSPWTSGVGTTFSGFNDYPRILGNFDVGGSGSSTVNFRNENYNATPVLVQGNTTIQSGNTLTIGDNGSTTGGTGFDFEGTLTVDGTLTYESNDADANNRKLVFSGTSAQSISVSGTLDIYNMELDNSNNLTLNNAITVDNILTFTSGDIITTSSNLLTIDNSGSVSGTSDNSHVNGPVAKNTNTTTPKFTFPTGDGTNYRKISITPSSTDATTWTAQYYTADYGVYSYSAPVQSVSDVDNWDLSRSGSANSKIEMAWHSGHNVTDYTKLLVAHYTGALWESAEGNSITGDNTSGTLESNANWSSYSRFKIAASNGQLPIELLYFDAQVNRVTAPSGGTVKEVVDLTWATASETNNDYFTVEKAGNPQGFENPEGLEWESVTYVPGAGNSNQTLYYEEVDENPYFGISYYRLKQTDYDGKFEYSDLVAVKILPKLNFSVRPNPAIDLLEVTLGRKDKNTIFVLTPEYEAKIYIFTAMGEQVYEKRFDGTFYKFNIDVSSFSSGLYFVTLIANEELYKAKFVKE